MLLDQSGSNTCNFSGSIRSQCNNIVTHRVRSAFFQAGSNSQEDNGPRFNGAVLRVHSWIVKYRCQYISLASLLDILK